MQCNVLPVALCDVDFLQTVFDVVLEVFLWPAGASPTFLTNVLACQGEPLDQHTTAFGFPNNHTVD